MYWVPVLSRLKVEILHDRMRMECDLSSLAETYLRYYRSHLIVLIAENKTFRLATVSSIGRAQKHSAAVPSFAGENLLSPS
jgi:hypothetical protein